MIKPVIEAVRTVNEMSKLKKGLEWMRDNTLLVGIPDSGERKSKKGKKPKVTNAELLFIHTNGSPVNNIPKRPVIEPAIELNRDSIAKMINKTAELAMEGKIAEADKSLKKTGTYVVGRIKRYFVEGNDWPPNSPAVQRAKRKKGADNPRPLIDTAQMRNSITYVISKGGKVND